MEILFCDALFLEVFLAFGYNIKTIEGEVCVLLEGCVLDQ